MWSVMGCMVVLRLFVLPARWLLANPGIVMMLYFALVRPVFPTDLSIEYMFFYSIVSSSRGECAMESTCSTRPTCGESQVLLEFGRCDDMKVLLPLPLFVIATVIYS